MQLVVATFMIIVFVLSGYGLSTANPKGHDTPVGKGVERDKEKEKDRDDDKDKDEDKEKAHKDHEGDRESGKRNNKKHGLDRADDVAGQHGKQGRDNARKHQE